MKKRNLKLYIIIFSAFLGLITLITGCSDDDDTITVDKTTLETKITEAQNLINSTEEGTSEGQYQRGSKEELQSVIDIAQSVYDDTDATQTEVDNTVISLETAITDYKSKEVTPIAVDDLVGQWTFNEGSGTTLGDYSGNGFDGTLKSGNDTWGGGMPKWATDRYGDENKALSFDKGAYVEIPYNTLLNPSEMSISVWIKADEVLESNRFIGLHSWLGYKFQLQSANKAFFTAATTDGIFDKDTDPALELNTWYHLVVTVGDDKLVFYINGELTKTWDDVTGTMAKNSGNDLVFGRGSDEYAATTDNYDNDKIIPLDWGGYFHGSMDEVRIYKTVLTASQVASIYELEKVPEEE